MYTIPGTNIQIPMSIASGGVTGTSGLMSGDWGTTPMMYADPSLQGLNYGGMGFSVTDPTHMMGSMSGWGGQGPSRSIGYTLQDGNWMLDPGSLQQWTPFHTGNEWMYPLAFVGGAALGGSLMGLGEGLGAGTGTIGGEGAMLAGPQMGAMGELGAGGAGTAAGAAGAGGVMDPYLFSGLGEGGAGAAGAGGWTPSGLSGADLASAGWTPGSYSGAGGLGNLLGGNAGLLGSLGQLAGGLYGANQAGRIADLARGATPWITGGGQAQAAQQLQRALSGDVTGLPGFQQAQNAAMTRAGRAMGAGGQYGGGAYIPGMANAASNQYMNYMGMLGNLAGVGQQPNYGAMQSGLGGQLSGYSTAAMGLPGVLSGLGSIGSWLANA